MRIQKRAKGRLVDTDESEMTATFVLSTDSTDRDGDSVNVHGIDYQNYLRNPVVLFNHDQESAPIAQCIGLWLDEIDGQDALLGRVQFSRANPKGVECWNMVKEGTLRGASISFLPIGPAERNPDGGGSRYERCQLLEFSVVPIPSNQDAVLLRLKSVGTKRKTASSLKVVEQLLSQAADQAAESVSGIPYVADKIRGVLRDVQRTTNPRDNTGHVLLSLDGEEDGTDDKVEKFGQVYPLNGRWFIYDHHNDRKLGPFDSREEAEAEAARRGYKSEAEADIGTLKRWASGIEAGIDALSFGVAKAAVVPGAFVQTKSFGVVQVLSVSGSRFWARTGPSRERRLTFDEVMV